MDSSNGLASRHITGQILALASYYHTSHLEGHQCSYLTEACPIFQRYYTSPSMWISLRDETLERLRAEAIILATIQSSIGRVTWYAMMYSYSG